MRQQISEVEAERIIDRRVMRKLSTDRAYRHAEDAESQATREDEIEAEVTEAVEREYAIFDHDSYWSNLS